jgi:Ca-activated chloride channel homolog
MRVRHLSRMNRVSHRCRRGTMMVLLCIMMIAFVVTAAFSVDVAYMHLVRAELRSATDAAAKAATQQLADEVRAGSLATEPLNEFNVREKAKVIAAKSMVAGKGLLLHDSDIEIGRSIRSTGERFTFLEGALPPNSVRIFGRRTNGSLAGNVGLFFGRALGTSTFEPQEDAVGTFINRNVVLVVDRSGSMKFNEAGDRIYGDGFGPESKIVKVVQSLDAFMAFLSASMVSEKVGLVSFSSDVTSDLPLTTSMTAVQTKYREFLPDGMTGIALGIDKGVELMNSDPQSQFVERTLVVLTDGQENVGRDGVYYGDGGLVPAHLGAVRAAHDAAAAGFTIFSITYCVDSPFGKGTMQGVAEAGNGKFYDATNSASLVDAFRDITYTLNTMLTH